MNDSTLILPGQTIPGSGFEEVRQGNWYWQTFSEDGDRVLSCITHVGSNYVEVESVYGHETRIHDDEFHDRLAPEPNYERVIECETAAAQDNVHGLISEMQSLCRKIGVAPTGRIAGPARESEETTALSVVSQAPDVKSYESSLIEAKEKKIPELQKKIKKATTELGHWLSAKSIPLSGLQDNLKDVLKATNDRLFSVRIYAGLAESAVLIHDGEPASIDEKVRLMQRRLYMDEECIAGYRAGGIECKTINDFDRWLLDGNVDRLLPFSRCAVSFRVRRSDKDRGPSYTLGDAILKIQLADADKMTFLYLRNGGKIWRLNAEFDFGERLFPAREEFDFNQRQWVKVFCRRPDLTTMISDGEYQSRVVAYQEKKRKYDEWCRKNPKTHPIYCPHEIDCSWGNSETDNYEPFDQSSVYYDDVSAQLKTEMDAYNRIVILLQGVLDRSIVFHPHLPANLWKPDGASEVLELIYDGSNVLTDGDPPSFEAYRAKCNQSLGVGSVTFGQEDYWERAEAVKKNARRDRSRWGRERMYEKTHYRPYGNPGPGSIAKIAKWKQRSRKAVYTWTRERLGWSWSGTGDPIACSITVPDSELLNLDAYKPGDFRQFYADPRTRRQYLQWAAALLTGEEYAAGNLKV